MVIFTARFSCRHPILCSMVAMTAIVFVARVVVPPPVQKVLCLLGREPIKGECETLFISSVSDIAWLAESLSMWIHSKLFGPMVPEGRWFSVLRRLAMRFYKGWRC